MDNVAGSLRPQRREHILNVGFARRGHQHTDMRPHLRLRIPWRCRHRATPLFSTSPVAITLRARQATPIISAACAWLSG